MEYVVPAKCRTNQILVLTRWRIEKVLALVLHRSLYIEFLLRRLDDRVSDSAAIDLLQVETLAVVVIESHLAEEVEPRRDVLVPLSIGMEDRAFRIAGWHEISIYIRVRRICDFPIRLRVIDCSAVARIEPAYRRHKAHESNASAEGILILCSLNKCQSGSRRSIPCLEKPRLSAQLLVQGSLIDDILSILD